MSATLMAQRIAGTSRCTGGRRSSALPGSSGGSGPARTLGPVARRQARQHPRRAATAAAAERVEEDLWQIPDREQWYQAKWCAADQPDWNPARIVRSTQLAPGVREVVVECEVSREKVPLRNAYRQVGQRASLRINSGVTYEVAPTCPPFPQAINREALLRVRNDMLAGETKTVKDEISVLAELAVLVRESEAPELYKATEEDGVEVGPFMGAGLQLRSPIAAVFRYPTVVMFCEGAGMATAKALIETGTDPRGLGFKRRTDVRMYYRAPNEASLCYRERYEEWGQRYGVQVTTSTRDTFSDMFDDDETLMYDPDTTAAVILTGGDEEAEAAAAQVCREAEIVVVVKQSEEAGATEYLDSGKPRA